MHFPEFLFKRKHCEAFSCTGDRLTNVRENSDSRHGNPIFLLLQMEAQAKRNKDCVGSFPPLQQEARRELNIFVNGQPQSY